MGAAPGQEWASQAALNSLLKYAPQREGLADLKRAAEEKYAGEVQAGRTEGTLGKQAAQAAVAPTKQVFGTAATEGSRGRALAEPILAALSGSSPFKAAAANEQAAGQERLAASQAHALSDLQAQKVSASELPAYTQQAAVAALTKQLTAIQSKGSTLRGTEAADVQSEVDKQRTEAKRDALTERGQNITHADALEGHAITKEHDVQTAAEKAEARREKAAEKAAGAPMTTKEQDEAASAILQIKHFAGEGGGSRAERVAALSEGRPEQSVKNAQGQTVKVPAVPAFKPDVKMSAALDWAEYGHLTRTTEKRLEQAGYNLEKLGIPKAPPPPKTAGQVGQKVQKAISGVF